jgi:hypothetical protein
VQEYLDPILLALVTSDKTTADTTNTRSKICANSRQKKIAKKYKQQDSAKSTFGPLQNHFSVVGVEWVKFCTRCDVASPRQDW